MYSGAGVLEKGDVRVETMSPKLFVEVKYCGEIRAKDGAHSVSFQREWAEKTILDAEAAGCLPVVALLFNDDKPMYLTTREGFETLIQQSQRLYALETGTTE